ncbi:hypothetical protein [Streptomyces sp. NPDC005004]
MRTATETGYLALRRAGLTAKLAKLAATGQLVPLAHAPAGDHHRAPQTSPYMHSAIRCGQLPTRPTEARRALSEDRLRMRRRLVTELTRSWLPAQQAVPADALM